LKINEGVVSFFIENDVLWRQIGVSGFSAGSHLASKFLTHFDQRSRPDFGILFYLVIMVEESTTPH
jgi:acetyl esterase/lipase